MARRKRQEEPENHERWLISYADFITLLFAFFVVMYSISSVNEGKYRVLSDTLSSVFDSGQPGSDVIQLGDAPAAALPITIIAGEPALSLSDLPFEVEEEAGLEEAGEGDAFISDVQEVTEEQEEEDDLMAAQALGALAEEVEEIMSPFVQKDLIDIRKSRFWLEIEMKSSLLFPSAKALLSRRALKPLQEIANIIKPLNNPIFIEGYTDNVPIRNLAFPSNWELSAARAASVVNLFTKLGVRAERMAAIGYGEHRPIADNKTSAGRDKNRRVKILVMADSKHNNPLEFYHKTTRPGANR